MATDGPDPTPCDPEILENGTPICVIVSVSSNRLERFVKSVAMSTGQRVDWHFYGGRAIVKAIGDCEKVRDSIRARAPDVTALQVETGGCDYVSPIHWLI